MYHSFSTIQAYRGHVSLEFEWVFFGDLTFDRLLDHQGEETRREIVYVSGSYMHYSNLLQLKIESKSHGSDQTNSEIDSCQRHRASKEKKWSQVLDRPDRKRAISFTHSLTHIHTQSNGSI